MQSYQAGTPGAPVLVLGHGAGAGERHPWMRRVAEGLVERGVSVVTFDFPYMEAGRGRPDPGRLLEEAFQSVWEQVTSSAPPGASFFAGGKSMGGRIASQTAARGLFVPAPAGLVFFGYPLHPPAAPAQRRDRHLPLVAPPMLFVHGTRDPFGDPAEMQALADSLPLASLRLIEGGDHSLQALKRTDPDARSVDDAMDMAAAWILETAGRGK